MQNKAVSPAGSSRTSRSASIWTATTRSLSWRSSAASPGGLEEDVVVAVQRPVAGVLDGDDDIDQRTEEFIANFYRQLQMERQVSLQLRYVRGDSLDRTP